MTDYPMRKVNVQIISELKQYLSEVTADAIPC